MINESGRLDGFIRSTGCVGTVALIYLVSSKYCLHDMTSGEVSTSDVDAYLIPLLND